FEVEIEGVKLNLKKPVLYKYTDPVKGEIYQPVVVVPPVNLKVSPSILLFKQGESITQTITVTARANKDISKATAEISASIGGTSLEKMQRELSLQKGSVINVPFSISSEMLKGNNTQLFIPEIKLSNGIATKGSSLGMRTISYDHIPELNYFYENNIKVLNIDLKTSGKRVGYIVGAGDKVPQALEQMGYEVIILNQNDIVPSVLSTLDAVITGVRAYNVHEYLSDKYEVLMEYVKNGGNLIVQYNTNTQIGPVKAKIGPYDFTISRTRVTDENAPVQFLDPDHPVLNYPNKITQKDFEGWIQERGIYFAAQRAPEFKSVLSMNDPGESPSDGSLIIANYGKGTFVYTGLVFFRELPAGVPGAYRLMANLIALNQNKP
ncbi:MAG TPA: PIG-L family deacetylase, partial [Parasegetibacter sp.]